MCVVLLETDHIDEHLHMVQITAALDNAFTEFTWIWMDIFNLKLVAFFTPYQTKYF